ncbi:DUF4097 family beta strand repeat-containing protein [Streptomyces sp. NPDC021093]|uniref:DUF4097 family beta strand repeat-containing protein n=1 Tax=Streptomyces sp. NPDC021093 TaxID=3365112 RepID=UPI0037AB2B73
MAVRTALRTRTLLAAGGAVLVALAATGCGTDVSDAPVEKKNFAFSGKALTIKSDNSAVDVVPADVKEIQVERQVDGWVFFGNGPDPVWKIDGDTLTLKVGCSGLSSNCEARHSVKVPRGTALTVDNDNGRVQATGFDTDLKVKTDNGEVRIKDMSGGKLDLESNNGRIDGEAIATKSVRAETDNGQVKLNFTAVPDLVDSSSNNGEIHLGLPKATYKVDTSSANGKITVDVPKADSSTHVVKARTDNGEITLQSVN